jgi:hypothetical protein
MADEKTDVEITPIKLESLLSKNKGFKYDFKKIGPSQKEEILNEMCAFIKTYDMPAERCSDLMFFNRAAPEHVVPLVKLSSRIYDVAQKHGTTFNDVVTGIVAEAETFFDFPREFPNSAYLLHAIYLHGANQSGNGQNMIARGIKAVEGIINSNKDVSEELCDKLLYGRKPMPEHGYTNLLDMTPQSVRHGITPYKK